jgi:ABC-type lipoprotein export system ATPase subunit
MIELRDVQFGYGEGRFALHVPALSVPARARTAAIGPSGSGKTTLLNLISGIERPDAGQVRTAGVEVDRLSPAARRSFRITHIGFVFQDFLLLDYLDVLQNILYPYRLHHDLRLDAAAFARARNLAKDLGIEPLLGRRPDALSQGERQRVAIARALVTAPKLILADEPTGNLDPAAKTHALDLLFEQCEALSMTLLMVTHDHGLLDRFEQVVDVSTMGRSGL